MLFRQPSALSQHPAPSASSVLQAPRAGGQLLSSCHHCPSDMMKNRGNEHSMRNMKLVDAWLKITFLSHYGVQYQNVSRIWACGMYLVVSDSSSFSLGSKVVALYKKKAQLFLKVAKLSLPWGKSLLPKRRRNFLGVLVWKVNLGVWRRNQIQQQLIMELQRPSTLMSWKSYVFSSSWCMYCKI